MGLDQDSLRERKRKTRTHTTKKKGQSAEDKVNKEVNKSFDPLFKDAGFPKPTVYLKSGRLTIMTNTTMLDSSAYENYNRIEKRLKKNLRKIKGVKNITIHERSI